MYFILCRLQIWNSFCCITYTFWGRATFRVDNAYGSQGRQPDTRSLFIPQCCGTFKVLGMRKQHVVPKVSISFLSSVDLFPWRSSVVCDIQRLCLQVKQLLFREFVFALINESVIVFFFLLFLWGPSAYASASTSVLWLIVLTPYWTLQLYPPVPRFYAPWAEKAGIVTL
jgi:hypothetical protein